jgi:hypothetical protein
MEEGHIFTSDAKLKYWGYGEWVEEPDLVNFEYEGIKCKIKRLFIEDGYRSDGEIHMFGGSLCGYICIPKDHPYFGKDYDAIEIDAHGGLTYSKFEEEEYWIGFDCSHAFDYLPSTEYLRKIEPSISRMAYEKLSEELKKYPLFNPIYRNVRYCIEECKSMVNQVLNHQNPHWANPEGVAKDL